MFDELIDLGAGDHTIKVHFPNEWDEFVFSASNSVLSSRVFAVSRLLRNIKTAYLKRCRDEISKLISYKTPKNRDTLEKLTGDYCSYILNSGHSPEQIKYMVNSKFFGRELEHAPRRELQDFFAAFPCRTSAFDVYMFATDELSELLNNEQWAIPDSQYITSIMRRHSTLFQSNSHLRIIKNPDVIAFDPSDARLRTETAMALTRAVAYTMRPHAKLEWGTDCIVTDTANTTGIHLKERPSPLRRRYRSHESYSDQLIESRKHAISGSILNEEDRNRIQNSLIGYSNAFHSDSMATQLMTVWSSLEGLLPQVDGDTRIDQIVKTVLVCQDSMYLRNIFQWSFIMHSLLGRDAFFEILDPISEYKDRLSKFIALLILPAYQAHSDKLGQFAAISPLTTYRGHRLVSASDKISDMWKLVEKHRKKVEWQVRRIYRERNRIVHRANPSPNVETLIMNLNEYFLVCVDVLLTNLNLQSDPITLDEVFDHIAIRQQHREQKIRKISKEKISPENIHTIIGFKLS